MAVGAALVWVGTAASADAQCECEAERITSVGHRGTGVDEDANPFSENTVPSFEQAVVEGAAMVELDVQHTADGALIVIHDDTVDRTTDGTGCVADLTLAELQALDADGSTLPTLEEVFAAVEVGINVEIKVNESDTCPATDRPRLAADVVGVIAGDPTGREVIVSSFDLDQLLAIRAVDPTVKLAYLTLSTDELDVAIEQGFFAVHPLALSILPADVARARGAGLEVNPWTVNDLPTMRRLASMGVDRIITDAPELVPEAIVAYCESLVCDDAGVDAAADGGPDGGEDGGSGETADGGCACRTTRAPLGDLPLALLLAAFVFATRARR